MVEIGTLDGSSGLGLGGGTRGARGRSFFERSCCEQAYGVEASFKVDNGYGLVVGCSDQRRDQNVEQLVVPACESQRS